MAQCHTTRRCYLDILATIKEANLQPHELLDLINELQLIFKLKANQIIQNFPADLLTLVFQKADFHNLELPQVLAKRTVSHSFNKVICSLPKIWGGRNLSRIATIFTQMRSLTIYPSTITQDCHFSVLTRLNTLKLIDSSDEKKPKFTPDMSEFSPLTNLTQLTLSSPSITSLAPFPALRTLYLRHPFKITYAQVLEMPQITQVIPTQLEFFKKYSAQNVRIEERKWTYQGEIQNGHLHGFGTLEYPDGEKYTGQFENGCFEGQGTLSSKSRTYEGSFHQQRRHGTGTLTYLSGQSWYLQYIGDFLDNKEDGRGTLMFRDGGVYVGEFSCGNKEGQGVYTFPEGHERLRWEGNWTGGNANGEGVLTFSNGDVYRGSVCGASFQGDGALIFANGDRFVGSFDKHLKTAGTHYFVNGDVFECRYHKGKEEIVSGVIILSNSKQFVGELKDGTKEKHRTLVFPGLGSEEGNFEDAQDCGEGIKILLRKNQEFLLKEERSSDEETSSSIDTEDFDVIGSP